MLCIIVYVLCDSVMSQKVYLYVSSRGAFSRKFGLNFVIFCVDY